MITIEDKREELKKVSDLAPVGSHRKVARAMGISEQYLYQIRAGKNVFTDSKENQTLLQKLIDHYRAIIRKTQKQYQNL